MRNTSRTRPPNTPVHTPSMVAGSIGMPASMDRAVPPAEKNPSPIASDQMKAEYGKKRLKWRITVGAKAARMSVIQTYSSCAIQ